VGLWEVRGWTPLILRQLKRVAGITVILVALGSVVIVVWASRRQAAPTQPIAFSHKVHAGDNRIACLYCHLYATRSTVAGVPAVQLCMGCHEVIAKGRPEIQKLRGYWDRSDPIVWTKVYDLPDYVYFSHKRHVLKGISCEACHGAVADMDQVRKVTSLDMGWCVACHRSNRASVDCLACHK